MITYEDTLLFQPFRWFCVADLATLVCTFSVCTFTWTSTVWNEAKLSVRAIHHIVVIYISMVLRTIYVTHVSFAKCFYT